jgi:DNA-binding CsgD family transcriptional regulator
MTTGLCEQDLRRVLDVIDAGRAEATGAGLAEELMTSLAALVPSDLLSFSDVAIDDRTVYVDEEWDGAQLLLEDQPCTDPEALFWQHYEDSPCSYPTRTGDDRSVTLLSDFVSEREWRQSPMYADLFRADGLVHELMCCMPIGSGSRTPRILFFRTTSDFTERDRLVMALLRPHLVEWDRTRRAAPAPLTDRQTELMRLVAAGHSNAEIAATLYVSPHTVRKHLENIFSRLGVTSRTAAVARAFPA